MEFRTLVITITSAADLKAHDVYLVVSLSGNKSNQKRRSPIHKAGSKDPWFGHTFEFTVDKAAALNSCLKFKIKKAKRTFCLKKDVGEVDVPVRDLLVNGGAGDVKPKELSCKVRSSSGETEAVLKISYKFGEWFPIKVPPADKTVTGYAAAPAPPASNLAVAYTPPMPGAAQYPQMAYQPNAVANYPAAPPPVMNANETATGYPLAPVPPATYQPPMPGAAPYSSMLPPGGCPPLRAYPPYLPGGCPPPRAYPPLGGYPPYPQGAYLPNTAPTYFCPPPANVHPPAGPGHPAPMPHAGRNFVQRVMSGVATATIWNVLGPVNDPGDDAWLDM